MDEDQELLDRIAYASHRGTKAFLTGMIMSCKSGEQEAAVFSGVAGAMAELLWAGRRPEATLDNIKALWRMMGESSLDVEARITRQGLN